jgi:predicted nucleic acid-binding protein
MRDKCFVDTNVLVYAHDAGAGEKQEKAVALLERLWDQRRGVVSTQVIQEFYVNVRRKARNPVSPQEARQLVEDYLTWEVVANDGASILEALTLEERYRISFWDALIVQAAQRAGAATLYSEDLGAGQRYGTVEVVNPFRG